MAPCVASVTPTRAAVAPAITSSQVAAPQVVLSSPDLPSATNAKISSAEHGA